MKKPSFDPLDLLRRLGDEYRHVEQEHLREPASRNATRNRLAEQLHELEEHFERVLAEWTTDDKLRASWRDFLRGRGPAPDEPRLTRPPLFRGRTDAGSLVELRASDDGGYDIFVDRQRSDHQSVPWHLDPDMRGRVQIGELSCDEEFAASPDAITALSEFVGGRAEPPWRFAHELFEDGLVDPELGLTPRGRRCLDRGRTAAAPPPRGRNICVLVADGARARVLVLDVDRSGPPPEISALVEVAELTNPALRARDTEMTSDTRMGRRGGASTPLRPTNDHRDHHRRDLERHFAALVAAEAAGVWRGYPSCELVVVAAPVMLGLLRPALERHIRAKDVIEIHEVASDLTKLSPSMLHDLLTERGLLPPRGRRSPILPTPGQPAA